MVARTLDKLQLKTPLESWDQGTIEKVVNAFTDEKFPTVCALNKIDHQDADKNIAKIAKQQDPNAIVLTSAISEVFLRKLAKQGYVKYVEGSDFVDTREDLIADGDPDGGGLKELDDKLKAFAILTPIALWLGADNLAHAGAWRTWKTWSFIDLEALGLYRSFLELLNYSA